MSPPEANPLNADKEALTVGTAIEETFGGKAPAGGVMAGALLAGAPPYQRHVLQLIGMVKVTNAIAIFLPIFTQGKYEPSSCAAPHAQWVAPFRGSVAYDWSLCCGQQWVLAAISSVFFVGMTFGSALGGIAADCLGRRPVIVYAILINAVSLLLTALVPDVVTYAFFRFVMGVASMAIVVTVYSLAVEWVPTGWRCPLVAFMSSLFALGELFLVPMALATEHLISFGWRPLTLLAGIISTMPALAFWFIPESPQWLHARGRDKEAIATLRKAADYNARSCPLGALGNFASVADRLSTYGLVRCHEDRPAPNDIFRQVLCRITEVKIYALALMWFTGSLTFYGITLAAAEASKVLGLPVFATISACTEIPSALLAAWLLEQVWFGRKLSISLLFALGGVCAMAIPFTGPSTAPVIVVLGKFFFTAANNGLYVYTTELYEASIRGSCLGFCTTAAKMGAIGAPYTVTLLSTNQMMLLFGGFALMAALACVSILPETLDSKDHNVERSSKNKGAKYGTCSA